MESLKSEIKNNPVMYIFVSLFATAITFFMINTVATQAYVDKNDALVRKYADSKTFEVREILKEIKISLKDNNKLIIEIIKKKN